MANKNKKKRKQKPLEIIYKFSENISKEESEERLSQVFDILFNEVEKNSDAKLKDCL